MALPDGCAIGRYYLAPIAETSQDPLEKKLQTQLDRAGASGSEQRVLSRRVGRLAEPRDSRTA